jgi:hypothetical protein
MPSQIGLLRYFAKRNYNANDETTGNFCFR